MHSLRKRNTHLVLGAYAPNSDTSHLLRSLIMTTTKHARVLILGSGPAGYSAAVYAARANLNPVIIAGMEPGGQLTTTIDVDNWPGDVEGLQGPELMERMRMHAERFNTQVIYDHISAANLSASPFRLQGDNGEYTC